MDTTLLSIFHGGSRTYFYSTLFFPREIRRDVFILYSFVRVADDYVDAIPQDTEAFYAFVDSYRRAASGEVTGNVVIDGFVNLAHRLSFEPGWIDAFLRSMEMDITVSHYETEKDLLRYLYGSSEVVGLMMARVLRLPERSDHAARLLGRAMQYINFIRDIPEDIRLGRLYFPMEELEQFGLASLDEGYVRDKPLAFDAFLQKQIARYEIWQKEAEDGYFSIPARSLIPVKTASDMYTWTARVIQKRPSIVYERKVKPSVPRIVATALGNTIAISSRRACGAAPWLCSRKSEE